MIDLYYDDMKNIIEQNTSKLKRFSYIMYDDSVYITFMVDWENGLNVNAMIQKQAIEDNAHKTINRLVELFFEYYRSKTEWIMMIKKSK